MDIDEGLERYAVLTDFNGLHSTIFQALHQIVSIDIELIDLLFLLQDILDNLQVCSVVNSMNLSLCVCVYIVLVSMVSFVSIEIESEKSIFNVSLE